MSKWYQQMADGHWSGRRFHGAWPLYAEPAQYPARSFGDVGAAMAADAAQLSRVDLHYSVQSLHLR